ncbi:bifunctional 4-hydroxy-2-oxoglutarate aldolase/2-dehydro-3-deoxy-phosphogluconate aldolase [Silvibacterium acidisoli]|uniref:bifunctional 4-hydroxy-2-oxoglutarate aldolase/2-dehydro-3-deoxy-phosphogluconate aldolase n=1 Tax=Acidobacteriaceae bacterium ZG23-2 TaxID=2883246 RepID=UPI00406C1D68
MANPVIEQMKSAGLIPVLRGSQQDAYALVEAMVAGGITVMEVTMTVPGAVDVLRKLKDIYGDRLLLGSGTVTTVEQCVATIEAGAEFVVSPSLHLDVIAKTKELGKVSMPGGLTPTEVITAWNAGADFVKIFPCSAMGGASYLKALKAPFPQLKLIPTGGVTVDTAADFIRAGAEALGVGSDLVNAAAVKNGTPEIITKTARAYVEAIAKARA